MKPKRERRYHPRDNLPALRETLQIRSRRCGTNLTHRAVPMASKPTKESWAAMSRAEQIAFQKAKLERTLILETFAGLIRSSRSRAGEYEREHGVNVADLAAIFDRQEGRCALTGIPLVFSLTPKAPDSPSLDRISNKGGYTIENVQLVSLWANQAKNRWGEKLFYKMCRAGAKHGAARKRG